MNKKKLQEQEIMETVNNPKNKLSISRTSRLTKISRSYIYYKRKSTVQYIVP